SAALASNLKAMKIGILGAGKLGEVLIEGLLGKSGYSKTDVCASVRSDEAKKRLEASHGIRVFTDNRELVRQSEWVILCVKPQQARDVLQSLKGELGKHHHLLSVCASINLARLKEWSGGACSVVRTMPNTPSKIGLGMTLLCADSKQDPKSLDGAKRVFDSI